MFKCQYIFLNYSHNSVLNVPERQIDVTHQLVHSPNDHYSWYWAGEGAGNAIQVFPLGGSHPITWVINASSRGLH